MRNWFVLIVVALMLCGCGAQPVFETVNDDDSLMVSASVCPINLDLPKEAAKPVMQSADGGSLYMCDGYTLMVQTFSGGDLDETVRQLTGYTMDQLQRVRTQQDELTRYDLVWSSAGEGGDQVGRAVLLDDGLNHYAVSVMADADSAGELQTTWKKLLGSVSLDTDPALPGKA